MRGHTCFAFGIPERVRLNGPPILVEARGCVFNKLPVLESLCNDFASHGVGKRYICADIEPGPHVRPLHRARTPWINCVETRAIPHSFQQMMEKNRMSLPGV